MASDRNNETRTRINNEKSRSYAYRIRMVPRNPSQKTMTAFQIQGGMRRESTSKPPFPDVGCTSDM